MRTTVDIVDPLFIEVKELAQRENRSVRSLIEDGLRLLLREEKQQAKQGGKRFQFDENFAWGSGDGLKPGVDLDNWSQIKEIVREDPPLDL